MNVKWRLRMAAAQREVWTGAELRRLLAERAGLELSAASISALMTKQPAQLKLSTLGAFVHRVGVQPERPARGRHHSGRGQTQAGPDDPSPAKAARGRSMPPL